jgi:hypothetical protein
VVGRDPAAEEEAAAGYPKSLDFGTVTAGETHSIAVSRLPGNETKSQVGHVSGAGHSVAVSRDGDSLALGELPDNGAYAGTVDLVPGGDGGEIALTASARDWIGWAVLWLVLGLLLATALHLGLRRTRPEWMLGRIPRSERGFTRWAILDSNQGPLPYQRSALTD